MLLKASESGENFMTKLHEKQSYLKPSYDVQWILGNKWNVEIKYLWLQYEDISRNGDLLELIFMEPILIKALIMLTFYWDLSFVKCFETHENTIW